MKDFPHRSELLALIAINIVAWIGWLALRPQEAWTPVPLLPTDCTRLTIADAAGSNGSSYRLQRHDGRWAIHSAGGVHAVSRADADALAATIAETTLQEPLPASTPASELGLDAGVMLQVPGWPDHVLGEGVDGRTYARVPDGTRHVVTPPCHALLARPPQAWRLRRLDLPPVPDRIRLDTGSLRRKSGRWWWQATGDDRLRWIASDRVDAWWKGVHNAPVQGYAGQQATLGTTTASLVVQQADRAITISWHEGLLLRSTSLNAGATLLQDRLLCEVPPPPPLTTWQPQHLSPLDPRSADRLRIGTVELWRAGDDWRTDAVPEPGQQAIGDFLERLAALPPAGAQAEAVQPAPLVVERDELHFQEQRMTPELSRLMRELPDALRSPRLVPADVQERCTAVVVAEGDLPPTVIERRDGTWPESDRALVEDLLEVLADARISTWRPAATPSWELVITLRIDGDDHIIRLAADGLVGLPRRDAVGMLDDRTRAALLGP